MTQASIPEQPEAPRQLSRSLQGRHLAMISIGGIIGAGLFVGSSTSIIAAGPAVFISYAVTGMLILLVMRMLGEMATALPQVRSFTEFARSGLGDGAGFVVGWLYWYFWVIVVSSWCRWRPSPAQRFCRTGCRSASSRSVWA
jgi:GABA permease